MTGLPLPEAILSAEEYERRVMASIFGTPDAEVKVMIEHDRALRALAFRDESGHRVVWSAEEVDAIIEERDAEKTNFRVQFDRAERLAEEIGRLLRRIAALEEEVEPLIEALERVTANFEHLLAQHPVRDATETIAEARAALARVRGPEPEYARTPEQHEQWIDLVHGPETCPTCGSNDRDRFLDGCADTGQPIDMTIDGDLVYGSPDAWHRGPERAEDSDD